MTHFNKHIPLAGPLIMLLALLCPTPISAQEIFRENDELWKTRDLSKSAPMTAGEKLVIRAAKSMTGELTIIADKANEISVTYVKRAKADTRSRAIDYIDLIALDLNKTSSRLEIQLRAPNPAPWAGTAWSGGMEVEVRVPEEISLEIDALYFDVTAEGPFSGVLIPSSLGRIEVTDVDGPVEVATANRRLTLSQITGPVSARTRNSTLLATDIDTDGKQASFRNDGGDIHISGITGEVSASNVFGRIEITEFNVRGRRNVIRGQSAPVSIRVLELSDGQLVVSNRLEDIEITLPSNVSAEMTLAVDEGGKIEVNNFKFMTDLVQRDRLGLVAGDGDGFVSSSISGRGNIYIRGID